MRPLRTLIALAAVALVASCGFQLRGQTNLPFDTLYVPANSPLSVELKRNIAAGTSTRLVERPEDAQARMLFQG